MLTYANKQKRKTSADHILQQKQNETQSMGFVDHRPKAVYQKGMPEPVRAQMESIFQTDFSDVAITPNSSKALELGALAYTRGNEIHFAPGRYNPNTGAGQRLLGHELAHVVQQREGRVRATGAVSGRPLNDSPQLEYEADTLGRQAVGITYGSSLESAAHNNTNGNRINHSVYSNQTPLQGSQGIMQLKSTIKTTPRKTNADTPIATLSNTFNKYYKQAGLPEVYNFHQLTNVPPSNYSQRFDIAQKAEASIDPASRSKASGSNRDNNVIIPYGHFGVMERAIFGRQNLGGTYDGGHLVEHTLMEGTDADIHGNIAPQENKNFNQGLMRGWESLPEHYMAHQKFDYTVEVNYGANQYTRTGKQIFDAGVLDSGLKANLSSGDMTKLESEVLTFERWVPFEWIVEIDAKGGNFGLMVLTAGAHLKNIELSPAAARSAVEDTTLTAHSGTPGLMRQKSGTLRGHIETLAALPPGKYSAGNTGKIKATMYQPQPLDILDQPQATSTSGGQTPAVLPASTISANLLSATVSRNNLMNEIQKYEPMAKGGKKRKADSTVDQDVKKISLDYKRLRADGILPDAQHGALFVREFKKLTASKTAATNVDMYDAVKSGVKEVKDNMLLLAKDPNLQA